MNYEMIKLTKGAWVELADNEDYLIQNKDESGVYIMASDTEPTVSVGLKLPAEGVVTQTILVGKIWGRAAVNKSNSGTEIGQIVLVQK